LKINRKKKSEALDEFSRERRSNTVSLKLCILDENIPG